MGLTTGYLVAYEIRSVGNTILSLQRLSDIFALRYFGDVQTGL